MRGTDVKDLKAVILAGGLGTRLRQAVADRPKVLAEVCGHPFLAFLLDFLAESGVPATVLATGYMGHLIRQEFGERFGKMDVDYSEEHLPLGTGGALRLALPRLGGGEALVLNGDSYCRFRLAEFVAGHRAASLRPHASLLTVRVADTQRFGRVLFDENRRITAFEEKGASAGPGWINAGVYLVPIEMIRKIPADRAVSLERDMFPDWLRYGLFACPCDGPFIDIGTPQSYQEAQAFFGSGGGQFG